MLLVCDVWCFYINLVFFLSYAAGVVTHVDYITFRNCTVAVAYCQVDPVTSRFTIYMYRVLFS